MANKVISKSEYLMFLKHPAWLWLKKFDKDKLPPVDENLQVIFDAGHQFELIAEKLFPQAVKLGFDGYDQYKSLPTRTQKAIDNGAETILQGRLQSKGITCIFDVLQKVSSKQFDLIEIKSSTKVKPTHLYDLAFQTLVLENAGYSVRKTFVIHVNNEYAKDGRIIPEEITKQVEVTKKVKDLAQLTQDQVHQAQQILKKPNRPDLSPRHVNRVEVPGTHWFQDWLKIFKTLKPDLDKYSIYNLSYPKPSQIARLEDAGIDRIADIPKELALRDKQLGQIQTTKTDQRIIKKDKIEQFLNSFQFPLYFLDYETFSSTIPQFDGCKPYKDYPFQYSLHILKSPKADLIHKEYLHNQATNPMPPLLSQLKKDIGTSSTILTWNQRYEKGCNSRLAKQLPQYADFLEKTNQRIEDLMKPFSNMWFVDKDFFGSASIKNVLPALVPNLTYQDQNIADGLTARRLWTNTILKQENQANKDQVLKNLSDYCTLDTYAIVKIYRKLLNLH